MNISLNFNEVFLLRKKVKCFSNDGSQAKQFFPGWVSNTEKFALAACLNFWIYCLCAFICKSVNIHWQMPSLSVPSYKLGRRFKYKKLFSSCLVIEERDTSIAVCCLRCWIDHIFFCWLPGLEESQVIWNLFIAFLKCTSSFPTQITQAESLALSSSEQQKLLVPPAVLIKREKGFCWFVWYQRRI